MLTARQKDCLDFISQYQRKNFGHSPSFEEIRVGIGAGSKSIAFRLVSALEERGFIHRPRHDRINPHTSPYAEQRLIHVLRSANEATTTRIPVYDAETLQLREYLP